MMTCDTMVGLVLEKQVVAMKICHDIVAARISHQMEEATYGTGF